MSWFQSSNLQGSIRSMARYFTRTLNLVSMWLIRRSSNIFLFSSMLFLISLIWATLNLVSSVCFAIRGRISWHRAISACKAVISDLFWATAVRWCWFCSFILSILALRRVFLLASIIFSVIFWTSSLDNDTDIYYSTLAFFWAELSFCCFLSPYITR